MKFRSTPLYHRTCCSFLAAVGLLASPSAHACGPIFPNSYLASTEAEILAAPEAYFHHEISRLIAKISPAYRSLGVTDASATDLAELRAALTASEITDGQRAGLLEAYQRFRNHETDASAELPEDLPAEFADYARGAAAWHTNDLAAARAAWTRVLALPAEERMHRATWAAFMLGKLALRDQAAASDEAVQWFQQTRALAAEGFVDSLGLAAESYGWEARAELDADHYREAIALYLAHAATGDASAIDSLRITANAALFATYDEDALLVLAKDANARLVLTAYLLGYARYDYDEVLPQISRHWTEVLHRAALANVPGADRLAWIAYENGLFALAADWARLAPETSAEGHWIKAKLALRGGSLAAGERELRAALNLDGLAPRHRPFLWAELGRTCLAQDHPVDALDAWIAGAHLEDSTYLAERVLTLEELRSYVDAKCPAPALPETPPDRSIDSERPAHDPAEVRSAIRHLLARRLARAARFDEATPYFPEALQILHTGYVQDIRQGYDPSASDAERAEAFWRAAQTLRAHGLDLIGTELDPDWAIWDGAYALTPEAELRLGAPRLAGGVLAPTPAEIARLTEHPTPEKRFHYRYRAADLAWWAAALLPNNDELTAEILETAGRWLAARDPASAQRFYQALVLRCGATERGRAAAAVRWFPSSPAKS